MINLIYYLFSTILIILICQDYFVKCDDVELPNQETHKTKEEYVHDTKQDSKTNNLICQLTKLNKLNY